MNLNKFKPNRRSIREWFNDIDKIKTIGIVARFFEMIFFMISKIFDEAVEILRIVIRRFPKITFFVSIFLFLIFSKDKFYEVIKIEVGDVIIVLSSSLFITVTYCLLERIELIRIKRFIDNFKETFSYRYVRK